MSIMFLVQNALLFLLTINTRHGQMKRHKTLQCMYNEVTPSNVKGTFSLCFPSTFMRLRSLQNFTVGSRHSSTSLEFIDLFPICTLFCINCQTNSNIICNQIIIFRNIVQRYEPKLKLIKICRKVRYIHSDF